MPSQSAEWIVAARVLRRSGFGVRGEEVDAAVQKGGPSAYVEHMLSQNFSSDAGVKATPMPAFESSAQTPKATLLEQKRDLTYWWLRRMAVAEYPLREKLTLLWHNHFATAIDKVRIPALMARQNEKLRSLCLSDFTSLSKAMLTDAATIAWLDGDDNRAGTVNENLAREFMELFALGHNGGYSERDVREGARALTGWTVAQDGSDAKFDPRRHDASNKTVLGTTGRIDAERFCNIVLSHKSSSPYIIGRLWGQLASDEPASGEVRRRLMAVYEPERDLRKLTAAILSDRAFVESRATVISSPVDWLIGIVRSLRFDLGEDQTMEFVTSTLRRLGHLPMHPPDVSGWAGGRQWLSTAAANNRLIAATTLAENGDLSRIDETSAGDRIDAVGYLLGIGSWSDRTVRVLKPLARQPGPLLVAAVNSPEYLTS